MNLKKLAISIFFVAGTAVAGCAATAEYDGLNGSMTPISLPDSLTSWWPDSLSPYFVNHVGRHGARFLSSESKVSALLQFLQEQSAGKNLTSAGQKALELLNKVKRQTAGRWGALTELGREEERKIAELTLSLCPELLKKGKAKSVASYVPRVVDSQYCFLMPVAEHSKEVQINASSGQQYDRLLRPFDYFKDYAAYRDKKTGSWASYYDAEEQRLAPQTPIRKMLKDGSRISDKEARKLSLDFYAILQGMPAAGLECEPSRWFTIDEYKACAELANMQRYLRNSDNRLTRLPARSAIPLLMDLLTAPGSASADEVAALRFGHAETLMPLVSLMGIIDTGAADAELTAEDIWQHWKAAEIVPLGANLQIIYLRAPSGYSYVAMMYNQKPIAPYRGAPALVVPLAEWQAAMLAAVNAVSE